MDDTDMAAKADPGPEAGSTPGHDASTGPQIPTQDGTKTGEHFDTPSWIGSNRPWQPYEQTVPAQAAPAHESMPVPVATDRDSAVISEGHWVEHAPPRLVAGTFLVAAILGLIGALVASVITQSPVAIGVTVTCAVIAVVFRGALISSGVRTVELKSGRLTVSQDGHQELFNLTDPAHLIELTGRPTDSDWRLRLETLDGRIVELTRAHVNPSELHPAVVHYRRIADRERTDRERRFHR